MEHLISKEKTHNLLFFNGKPHYNSSNKHIKKIKKYKLTI